MVDRESQVMITLTTFVLSQFHALLDITPALKLSSSLLLSYIFSIRA